MDQMSDKLQYLLDKTSTNQLAAINKSSYCMKNQYVEQDRHRHSVYSATTV